MGGDRDEHLTADERETTIHLDDASGDMRVTTWQRRIITRLIRAGWEPVERLRHGSSRGAVFVIPARALTLRSRASVERPLSDAERARNARGEFRPRHDDAI